MSLVYECSHCHKDMPNDVWHCEDCEPMFCEDCHEELSDNALDDESKKCAKCANRHFAEAYECRPIGGWARD